MLAAAYFAIVFATASILATWGVADATSHAGGGIRLSPSHTTRPSVIENGSDVVVLPLPAGQGASNLAFAPDGTAYFMNGSNEVDRVSPDGAYAKISVPGAYNFLSGSLTYGKIIYARGNLWMSSTHGIVKVAPDGSQRRVYQLVTTSRDVTLGPDGAIYATAQAGTESMFYRIASNGVLTSTALPVYADGLVSHSDGNLYTDYVDIATGTQSGIARIHPSGAIDLIPGFPTVPPLASSNGNVYFQNYHFDAQGTAIYELARLDRNGIVTEIPLPPSVPGTPPIAEENLSVDKGGNLWTIVSSYYGSITSLYQYNVYTGHFSKPIQADSHFYSFYGETVTVGPDDNIWWAWPNIAAQALVVYTRNVQTLEPASLLLDPGMPAQFTILETHASGPWTSQSLNPSVAAVAPASSTTGTFSVKRTGVGMTSIAIKDRLGNVSYGLVTAR